MTRPATRLTSAAAKASPNDSFSACRVRVLVTVAMNCARLSSVVLTNRPASGIRISSDSQVSVRPMVRPNPGNALSLGFAPAAEDLIDGEQIDLGERRCILARDLGIARTIEITCGNFLALLGVPILQVGLGDVAGAFFLGNLVNHGNRRLGEDGN